MPHGSFRASWKANRSEIFCSFPKFPYPNLFPKASYLRRGCGKRKIPCLRPETYVRIEPADASLPQKICYCGEKIVVLENVQEEDKAFRLFIIRKDDFWAWLTDSVDISATVFDKREEALHMLEFCPIAGEERALLLAQEHPEAFCKAGTWMVRVQNILKENAYASLRFVDGATGTLQKEVLFVQGSMNTWVLWCVPCADIFAEQVDCVYVEPDSVELRGKLLKTMNRRDAE